MKFSFNESGSHWRVMANFWMTLALLAFAAEIFFPEVNKVTSVVAIVYVAILSIYAGTKECNRWNHYHKSRHLGEFSIIIWTLFLVALVVTDLVLKGKFIIPSEVIVVYTAVLAIFAVTQRSKFLFQKKEELTCQGVCPVCGNEVEMENTNGQVEKLD